MRHDYAKIPIFKPEHHGKDGVSGSSPEVGSRDSKGSRD